MSVEGNLFLKGLYQSCKICFQKTDEDDHRTVQELLMDKVQQACNQGIISDRAAEQIEARIGNLKERSVTQLTPSEQNRVLDTISDAYEGRIAAPAKEAGEKVAKRSAKRKSA